ncbi:MAG: hypothetical protein ACO3TX_13465, partial [Pseudomonadales bacterium]
TLEADQSVSTNTPKDVWVVGSFKSLSLAERFAAGFDRAFDLRTTILESDQDAEGNTWFRVSIERPGSEAARASLRQALEELGLERPWRLVINRSQAQALPTMIDALDAISNAVSSSSGASYVEPVENEIISRGFAVDNAPVERPPASADTTSPEPTLTSSLKSGLSAGLDELLEPASAVQIEPQQMFDLAEGSSTPQETESGTPDRISSEPVLTKNAVRQNSPPLSDPIEAIDQRPLSDEASTAFKSAPVAVLYTEQPVAQADDQASVDATSSLAAQGAESVDLSSPGIPADAVSSRPFKHEQTSIGDPLIESENGPEVLQSLNETDMTESLTSDKQTLPAPLSASIALSPAQSSIEDVDDGVIDRANSESIAVAEPANESPEGDLGVADGSELSPSNTQQVLDVAAVASIELSLGATDPRSAENPGQQGLKGSSDNLETDENDLAGTITNSENGGDRATIEPALTLKAAQMEDSHSASSEQLPTAEPALVRSDESRVEGPIQKPSGALKLSPQSEADRAELTGANTIAAGSDRLLISKDFGDIKQNGIQSSIRVEDPMPAPTNVPDNLAPPPMDASGEDIEPDKEMNVGDTFVASGASSPFREIRADAKAANARSAGVDSAESNASSSSSAPPTEVTSRSTTIIRAPASVLDREATNTTLKSAPPSKMPKADAPRPAPSMASSGAPTNQTQELVPNIDNRIKPAATIAPTGITSTQTPDSKANLRLSSTRSIVENDPIRPRSTPGTQPALSQKALQSGAALSAVRSGASPRTDPVYQQFMDKDPRDFAVQLKAERVLEDIRVFAQSVDMEEPTILKIKPFKAPIYVLILDTFSDFELASEAKNDWMAQQDNDIEPWIRTVESLQKVLEPMGPNDQ